MARGVNKVILVGNVGKDPELRYGNNGNAMVNLTVATSERWKDKTSGETQEKTEWHRLVAFNRLAEIIGEYVKKGSQVYIEGKLQTRKWQGADGEDKYTTEIVANELQMLGVRQQGQAPAQQQAQAPAPAPAPAPQGDFDDDVPF